MSLPDGYKEHLVAGATGRYRPDDGTQQADRIANTIMSSPATGQDDKAWTYRWSQSSVRASDIWGPSRQDWD